MKRAYTNIAVSRYINVSSTGHYFGKVVFRRGDRGYGYDVDLSNGIVMTKRNMDALKLPAYVMDRIRALYIAVLEGDAVFYEYNRDGEKRFEDLRYWTPKGAAWIIQCLRKG